MYRGERARGSEYTRERETRCGRGSRMAHSCFIGPVETHACHEGGVGGRLWAHARERRKTRMRLMIYTPATVYYRLEPLVRGYHPFVFSFLFFHSSSFSRALRYSLSPFSTFCIYATISCIFYIYIVYFIQTI